MPRSPYRRERLREWFAARALGAFALFVVAYAAWAWSGILLASKTLTVQEHWEYLLTLVKRNLVTFGPIYVAVVLADGVPVRGIRRYMLLAAALVAGALAAVQVRCAAMPDQLLYAYGSVHMPYCTAFPTWRAYVDFPVTWITPLSISAAIAAFLFGRRRDAELSRTLRASASAQIESRRQRIESEIVAMHSRVDPDSLLASLREVRVRYARDPAEGESGLQELITGLRAAAGRPVEGASGAE